LFGERVASACFTQKYYQDLTSFIARAVMNPKSQIWWTSSQKKNTNFCPTWSQTSNCFQLLWWVAC